MQFNSHQLTHEHTAAHDPIYVGKYLVSPLPRALGRGRYTAAVSIRRGTGSMTNDRVMRFDPVFGTSAQAARFATEQALAWLGEPSRADHPYLTTTE